MKSATTKISGWTPIFDHISKQYSPMVSVVYGIIWRYSQMRDGVCKLGQEKMGELLGVSTSTIQRGITILEKDGYIVCVGKPQGHPNEYVTTDKLDLGVSVEISQTARQGQSDSPTGSVRQPDKDTVKDTVKDIYTPEWKIFIEKWARHLPNTPKVMEHGMVNKRKFETRIKEKYFRENYEKALERVSQGYAVDQSWFDGEWFLKNDNNWVKCLNGKYDNQATPFRKKFGLEVNSTVPPLRTATAEEMVPISKEELERMGVPWKT